MKKLDWINIIHDTYVELYKNSEPSADFNELVLNSKANDRKDAQGRYVIDFMAYEIDQQLMDDIIEANIEKYKINKWNANQFKQCIYLGCSPKSKIIDKS